MPTRREFVIGASVSAITAAVPSAVIPGTTELGSEVTFDLTIRSSWWAVAGTKKLFEAESMSGVLNWIGENCEALPKVEVCGHYCPYIPDCLET